MQPFSDTFYYAWYDSEGKEIRSRNFTEIEKSRSVIAHCTRCGPLEASCKVAVIVSVDHTTAQHLLNTAYLNHIQCGEDLRVSAHDGVQARAS